MRLIDVRESNIAFGFSPLRECLRGIEVFTNPSHHAEQMPWLREARRRLSPALRKRIERFRFFFEPRIETFAFAWPQRKTVSFEAELRALRADLPRYRDAVVKRLSGARLFSPDDMRKLRRAGWYRGAAEGYAKRHVRTAGMLREFVASPARSLDAFCACIGDFYAQAVEHRWDAILQRLNDDIEMRKAILRNRGLPALIRTLAREITASATGRGVAIECPPGDGEMFFGANGHVLLTPSFFAWPHAQVFVRKTPGGTEATIAYPMPPLTVRARSSVDGAFFIEACKALGDPMRLRILELLRERDVSTREIAGFLDISEPAASRHLKVLAGAGLVDHERDGYFVMYRLRRATMDRVAAALSALR